MFILIEGDSRVATSAGVTTSAPIILQPWRFKAPTLEDVTFRQETSIMAFLGYCPY